MGQAKLRGSFEERKAFAIKRNKKEAEERKVLLMKKEVSATDISKAIKHKRRIFLASASAFASVSKGL